MTNLTIKQPSLERGERNETQYENFLNAINFCMIVINRVYYTLKANPKIPIIQVTQLGMVDGEALLEYDFSDRKDDKDLHDLLIYLTAPLNKVLEAPLEAFDTLESTGNLIYEEILL